MAFKKGQSGNPSGRKKGTPNKTTREFRDVIHSVISSGFSKTKVLKDLNELSPKQRLDYMLRLMEYVVAKPKSVEEKSEKTETMDEKYSRITAYINSAFNVSGENRKNNADKSGKGSLVRITPGGSRTNDDET